MSCVMRGARRGFQWASTGHCGAPVPLTPAISPRRGSRAGTQRDGIALVPRWPMVHPLLGERAGVRGTETAGKQKAYCQHLSTHRNRRGSVNRGRLLGSRLPHQPRMSFIDSILNVAGVLLWVSWRSLSFDPLVKPRAASLLSAVKRTETPRFSGWHFLA